jgi:energy-coupling factor transporter ATP-binding protein EcfA2
MNGRFPTLMTQPPSRLVNPFATCWTRPGALPYCFSAGQSAEQLVAKLAAQHWRGAIVGPHGSGKSTLLESLKPVLVAAGQRIDSISLHDGQCRLPDDFRREFAAKSNRGSDANTATSQEAKWLIIIDGYEQLAWLERLQLLRVSRRNGAGLLVTSHTPVHIPTLIRLAPDLRLVERLVAALCARVSTAITPADVAASHACHGSNVREILFDLYDRHEQRRRELNRRPAAS